MDELDGKEHVGTIVRDLVVDEHCIVEDAAGIAVVKKS